MNGHEEQGEGHVVEGVPGHVAWRGWARELQSMLRHYGIPYEAELDHTRLHYKALVIQAYPEPRGYVIDASLPLPLGEEDPDTLEEMLEGYRAVLLLTSSAKGVRPSFELDTSLPYNPVLHVILFYTEPEPLLATMKAFLDRLTKTMRQGP